MRLYPRIKRKLISDVHSCVETQRIVELANSSFAQLAKWIALADQWAVLSNLTREALTYPNVTEQIDVLEQVVHTRTIQVIPCIPTVCTIYEFIDNVQYTHSKV